MPFINSRGFASAKGFALTNKTVAAGAIIPATLIAQGTKILPTKGSQYNLTTSGLYYVDLISLGYSSVTFSIAGASGGQATSYAAGKGGMVGGTLSSSTGVTYLALVVGGQGSNTSTSTISGVSGAYVVTGGYNGGAIGINNSTGTTTTGGGGGASDVSINWGSSVTDYSGRTRILVGGGGGGSTNNTSSTGGNGGYPNGVTAPNPNVAPPGGGGTQSAGGTGAGTLGNFGNGGFNNTNTGWNGGGGGGWYGGSSCGQHNGGGGGSSYYNPSYISSFTYSNGYQSGAGFIYLTVY